MRIQVNISRLESALQEVRNAHPFRGNAIDQIYSSLIDKVREKLESCPFDNLSELAFTFNIREILACLEILANDRNVETIQKAAHILKLRPRKQVVLRGWFKLVSLYPHDLLERTLRDLITAKGFGPLEKNSKISSRIAYWFVSVSLSEGVFRDYKNASANKILDEYLSDNLLMAEDGLYHDVWRRLLTKGIAKLIKKEDCSRILSEFNKVSNATYLPWFGQHYLNALKTRDIWDEPVLELIERRFGSPSDKDRKSAIETPFWGKVSDPAKQEFRTWLMLRLIQDFFEGERADFWEKYVQANLVKRVKEILHRDGFMIDFGHFGVIEFKYVGNAAYIYPANVFAQYWVNSGRWYNPGDFKDKYKTVKHGSHPGWDGRIIHRDHWQSNTSKIIGRLLR
ncbi:MAG: hypothetical protein HQ551_03455 [Desulfobacteraceae bacterium]|nr:hypothetical protein [Desulfobacteraceae bacterium]